MNNSFAVPDKVMKVEKPAHKAAPKQAEPLAPKSEMPPPAAKDQNLIEIFKNQNFSLVDMMKAKKKQTREEKLALLNQQSSQVSEMITPMRSSLVSR